MWELDHKESWVSKNWCFWTVVLEKTLESPLDCKEMQPVHPKGNQSWILIGRTDVEAEAPILWPPDAKSRLIGKEPKAGKDQRQKEKGMTENEMVGWHHWLDGHEYEESLGVGDGRGSLACCSPWRHRVRHDWVTELNWTDDFLQQCFTIFSVQVFCLHFMLFHTIINENIFLISFLNNQAAFALKEGKICLQLPH